MISRLVRRPLALAIAASALVVSSHVAAEDVTAEAVVSHYTDLAHTTYSDALKTAKALDEAIDSLLAAPTPETLAAAKKAWREARVPYQQSEVFRFGFSCSRSWRFFALCWCFAINIHCK